MSKYNKPNNTRRYNVANEKYKPSIIGKIAMGFAVPAAAIGLVSVMLAFFVQSAMVQLIIVGMVAEVVAFLGGIVIVVDIVLFNRRLKKEDIKNGRVEKKEKNIGELVHFIVGIGIGLLLGYLFWGR